MSLLLVSFVNLLFFGFSSILIAHLFGKHPFFRSSFEQVPNKTPLKVKKVVSITQTPSNEVKSSQIASNFVKRKGKVGRKKLTITRIIPGGKEELQGLLRASQEFFFYFCIFFVFLQLINSKK